MSAHAGVKVCVLIMVFVITESAPDTSSTWIRAQPQQVTKETREYLSVLHLN